MDTLQIKTNNFDSIIELQEDRSLKGAKIVGDKITKIDSEVLDYLNLLLCSKNRLLLEKKEDYEIYLDNATNFRHKFQNGIEDTEWFFDNNGESLICYKDTDEVKKERQYKKFTVLKDRVECMIIATLITLSATLSVQIATIEAGKITSADAISMWILKENPIVLEEVQKDIYSSPNLTEEEKAILYNEAFISDVLKSKNVNAYYQYEMRKHITDISIESFSSENPRYDALAGFYNKAKPNVLNIRDYNELNEDYASTIAHEYVHLWQDTTGYNILIEATAEMIAHEYFGAKVVSYQPQILLTKILMEIIGPEPIWDYVFTGDFSEISNRVKPNLTNEEYEKFIKSLSFDRTDKKKQEQTLEDLADVLSILYQNIYGTPIENDEAINLMAENKIDRYYFNKRKMIKENSFYEVNREELKTETYTFEEACAKCVMTIYAMNSIGTPHYDYAIELSKSGENEKKIERVLDVTIEEREEEGRITYYCNYKGHEIKSDNKEIVEDSIIELGGGMYKVVEYIPITYEQYKNRTYRTNEGIKIRYTGTDIDIENETVVYAYIETIVDKYYAPLVTERERPWDNTKIK